jgi:hypothetical protein
VGLTAAMMHYSRRPPHSISPRKEAGRGDGKPRFPTRRPKRHLVGGREDTTFRAPSPRLCAGRGEVRGVGRVRAMHASSPNAPPEPVALYDSRARRARRQLRRPRRPASPSFLASFSKSRLFCSKLSQTFPWSFCGISMGYKAPKPKESVSKFLGAADASAWPLWAVPDAASLLEEPRPQSAGTGPMARSAALLTNVISRSCAPS